MRLLVTRPEPDGERTAALLRARGCEVMQAPLLRIELVDADLDGGPWHALALTSANAARATAKHARLKPLLTIPAYTVGGRTAETAFALGFENVISADGDVTDLVRVIKTHLRRGARMLYLAGDDRAGDLGGELAKAGMEVTMAIVYRAAAVSMLPPEVRAALLAGRLDGVLHFSRRSAGIYVRCAADILERALAPIHYCLSRQVAEPLAAVGAAKILVAEQPREADLIKLATD